MSLPSTVNSSVEVSLETTPLSATHVYVPLSDRDTLEMRRRDEEVLVLELSSVMVTWSLLFSVDPFISQEISGAGTPNARHCSSAVSPMITSGPSVKFVSVIWEGSLKVGIRVYKLMIMKTCFLGTYNYLEECLIEIYIPIKIVLEK